jgi:hypothetical protein
MLERLKGEDAMSDRIAAQMLAWEKEAAAEHHRCISDDAVNRCVADCIARWPSQLAGCLANSDRVEHMRPCFQAFSESSD